MGLKSLFGKLFEKETPAKAETVTAVKAERKQEKEERKQEKPPVPQKAEHKQEKPPVLQKAEAEAAALKQPEAGVQSGPEASGQPNRFVKELAEKLGSTLEDAEGRLLAAREQYGISYKDYVKYQFHMLTTEEEKQKVLQTVQEKKKKLSEQRAKLVSEVAEASGWDEKKALAVMNRAKNALGMSFTDYVRLKLYLYPEEEYEDRYQKLKEKRERQKKAREKKANSDPEIPFGGKISSITNEGIEYYWKKVELADGYEVFRSYSPKGEYELIYTAPKRNIGTYIDGEFDHSCKAVYYKVRSFIKRLDGSYAYSALTEETEALYQEKLTICRDVTYMFSGIQRSLYALQGWGQPEDGIWESDDPSVAEVDANGVISSVARGECQISFSSRSAGQTAYSKVVVDREPEEPLAPVTSRYLYDPETAMWKNPDSSRTEEAVIMMVGDLMCSSVQMRNQYSAQEGYNFNDSFTYVKDVMKESDFAVANLETLLASGWPYMIDEGYIENYNNCNAPSRYLDAVKYGGFDAVMMANNHNCDGGVRALVDTLEQVDRYQFARTGAFTGKEKNRFFIADINGLKVGFLAYITQATGFNYKELTWTQEERDLHLCIFDPERAGKEIAQVREAGAEYVIVYMHWGMKNFYNLTEGQKSDAQSVADAGADFILGANPHVLQCYDLIHSKEGKAVPCYYSTGNYQAVMNQVEGNRENIVVRLQLKRDQDGKVVVAQNQYIPSYAYRHCGRSNWAPVALSNAYNKGAVKLRKGKIIARIKETLGEQAEAL